MAPSCDRGERRATEALLVGVLRRLGGDLTGRYEPLAEATERGGLAFGRRGAAALV